MQSSSEPIDFLRHPALGGGRLGLTACPGRRRAPGDDDPLARDLRRWSELGVGHIVCLLPVYELEALGAAELPALAARAGFAFHHHPVDDGRAPRDAAAFRALCAGAVAELRRGQCLAAHCRAGFGRTGTFAACLLRLGGVAADDALRAVRAVRAHAVETREQERFVAGFA